nr:hypothetical protein [Arthrobacter sp. ISL-69]
MDGINLERQRRPQNRAGIAVAQFRLRGTDADGLIRHLDGQGVHISLGIGEHASDTQLFARPDDAQRDLSAIGDEHAF